VAAHLCASHSISLMIKCREGSVRLTSQQLYVDFRSGDWCEEVLVQKSENQRCENFEVCIVIETGIGDVGISSNAAFELNDLFEIAVRRPGKILAPDLVAHKRGCEVRDPVVNASDQVTVVLNMLSAKYLHVIK
jgi:hypothetical protein